MPKQTPAQQKTIERVMHEFKHHELTIGENGPKVRDPKQAVAIALREAGASNQEGPAENRRTLRHANAKERAGRTARDAAEGTSKADLYRQAQEKGVAGRSKMDKAELKRALGR